MRVVNVEGTAHLFHDAETNDITATPKPIRVWLTSSVGAAVLSHLRHRMSVRASSSSSSTSSSTFGGLVTTVPPGLMYDVAACMGNDFNRSVRTAMSAKGGSPWPVIERLLSRAAVGNGWISAAAPGSRGRGAEGTRDARGGHQQGGFVAGQQGQLRATQKLFTSMGLNGVVKHWEEFTSAREYYIMPPLTDAVDSDSPPSPPPSPQHLEETSLLHRRLADWETWPCGHVLRCWSTTGLGATSIWGCDEATYDALRPLRRAMAERVIESLPPGWMVTEGSFDSRWFVPLCASHPAAVDDRTGEYIGVHPDCFVPPQFAVKVFPAADRVPSSSSRSAGEPEEEEEAVDDWEILADEEEELEPEPPVEVGTSGLVHTLRELGALPGEYTPSTTQNANKGEYVLEIAQAVKTHLGIPATAACNVHFLFLHLMLARLVSTRDDDPLVFTRDVIDALAYIQQRSDAEEE